MYKIKKSWIRYEIDKSIKWSKNEKSIKLYKNELESNHDINEKKPKMQETWKMHKMMGSSFRKILNK